MKKLILLFLLTYSIIPTFAQEEEGFVRDGKWLVETGASFFAGFPTTSGGSILIDDGVTITQIGIDAGKFISEDFALKMQLGHFGGSGTSFTTIGAGGKYYLGGVAPIEANLGLAILDNSFGGSNTEFIGAAHIGYAIKAADNIYFEPKVGILYSNSDIAVSIKFNFALMF